MSKNVFDISQELMSNAYPGRGIILGRTPDNKKNVIAYFIMGRSENSRNRVFTETEDGIRTEAFDPSKMVDPSLIIYHPVRLYNGTLVVTNGDQTDTIVDYLKQGKSYFEALRTRQFEPDAPNYTSRISGVVNPDGSYSLSILKNFTSDRTANKRFFYEYDKPVAGLGHFIHTYQCDGDPLPPFRGEPKCIRIELPIHEFTNLLWNSLNEQTQQLIQECMDESVQYNRETCDTNNQACIDGINNSGLSKVYEVSDELRNEMIQACTDAGIYDAVIEAAGGPYAQDLWAAAGFEY